MIFIIRLLAGSIGGYLVYLNFIKAAPDQQFLIAFMGGMVVSMLMNIIQYKK